MVTVTRRYTFSAAHKLWNAQLSPEQNHAYFGACARLHGHNYVLELVLGGTTDPQTGFITNVQAIDALVDAQILSHVANRYLDADVAFLTGTISTVENVAACFYARLAPHIIPPVQLERVRLYESGDQWVDVAAPLERMAA